MKKIIHVQLMVMAVLFLNALSLTAQDEVELAETTKHCLGCHGQQYYTFYNSFIDKNEKKRMNPYLHIDSLAFKTGEHGSFSCDDCHSPDYGTYPHNAELKLEYKYTCQDCHGGDPTYAHLHFDEIEVEALNSVHAQRMGEAFKCEMCHSPHTNKLVASANKYSLKEIVSSDNGMCLSCHGNDGRYQIFSEHQRPILDVTHEWLPNQALHFKNVRCIECHTARTDTMMVAHNILPKEQAVKKCAECHSSNSMLKDKLYKYMSVESRSAEGLNAALKNESYVIGAHRSKFLNILSLIIFGMVLGGVAIHTIVRIIKRK